MLVMILADFIDLTIHRKILLTGINGTFLPLTKVFSTDQQVFPAVRTNQGEIFLLKK